MIFREYCELVVFVQLYTVQAMLALQNTFPGLGSKPVTNAPVFLEGGPTFRSSSRSRGLAHEECPKLEAGLRGSFASDMPVVMQNVRFICGHVGVGQDVRNAEEYSTFVMMRLRQDQALRMPGGVETLPAFWGMLQMQVEGSRPRDCARWFVRFYGVEEQTRLGWRHLSLRQLRLDPVADQLR